MAIQTTPAVLLFLASQPDGVYESREGRANEHIRNQTNYTAGGAGMSKVLSDLAAAGLITRVIDGKRTKRIALTKTGFAALESLNMVDAAGKPLSDSYTIDGAAPGTAAPADKATAKKAPKKAAAKKATAKKAVAKKTVETSAAAAAPTESAETAAPAAPAKKAATKKTAAKKQAAPKAATSSKQTSKAMMDEFHSSTISSIQELLYSSLKSAIGVERQHVAELTQENSELRVALSNQVAAANALQRELNASQAHAKKLEDEKAASAANTGALIAARDRLNNLFS